MTFDPRHVAEINQRGGHLSKFIDLLYDSQSFQRSPTSGERAIANYWQSVTDDVRQFGNAYLQLLGQTMPAVDPLFASGYRHLALSLNAIAECLDSNPARPFSINANDQNFILASNESAAALDVFSTKTDGSRNLGILGGYIVAAGIRIAFVTKLNAQWITDTQARQEIENAVSGISEYVSLIEDSVRQRFAAKITCSQIPSLGSEHDPAPGGKLPNEFVESGTRSWSGGLGASSKKPIAFECDAAVTENGMQVKELSFISASPREARNQLATMVAKAIEELVDARLAEVTHTLLGIENTWQTLLSLRFLALFRDLLPIRLPPNR